MRYDSSMQESVLQINGLTKTYGARTVVNDVSFDVRRGEMFGILGPNGSGKTTTVRMVLGIIQPDSRHGWDSRLAARLEGAEESWLPSGRNRAALEGPRAGRRPLLWPPQRADLH